MNEQERQKRVDMQWYALYCRSRHESIVHAGLLAKGYDSYLADYRTRVKHVMRLRMVQKNLLPGYVLISTAINPRVYLDILQTRSVVQFVGRAWPNLSSIPDDQ